MIEKSHQLPRTRARPWRRRLNRLAITLLGFTLLLAIVHRPLVFWGVRYFALRLAEENHLHLVYEIGGSIFTGVKVTNLQALPTEPGPVERIQIGTLHLRYSLMAVIRHGLPALLDDVDLRNVFVVVDPARMSSPERPKNQTTGNFPLFFPTHLNLENLNFILRSPTGDTEFAGLSLNIAPEKSGALTVQTLILQGAQKWNNLAANVTFHQRNLVLSHLVLGPDIAVARFNLDVSNLNAKEVAVGLNGLLFGAQISLTAKVTDLNAGNRLTLRADSTLLKFDKVSQYLNTPVPIHGALTRLALVFDGALEKPREWSGNFEMHLEDLTLHQQQLGQATANIKLRGGRVTVALVDQLDAENKVTFNAEAALPENLADFKNLKAQGNLEVTLPDLVTLTRDLPRKASGDVTARTVFSVTNGIIATDVTLGSTWIESDEVALANTSADLHLEKELTAQGPIFQTLTTRMRGGIESVRMGDYTSDAVVFDLLSRGPAITLKQLSLAKHDNRLNLSGTYTLPADMESWTAQPITAELKLDAPELAAFIAEDAPTQLAGSLTIHGRGSALGGVYGGAFTIAGRQIELNGLPVRTIDAEVRMDGNRAHLPDLVIVLDDRNRITASGNFGLAPPFDYDARLDGQLADLTLLQPLLSKMKRAEKIAGSLALSFQGKGAFTPHLSTPATALPEGVLTATGRAIAFGGLAVRTMDIGIEMSKGRALVSKLSLVLDEKNQLSGSGHFSLAAPFEYDGVLDAKLGDLTAFQPLLTPLKREEAIAGSLIGTWRGNGAFRPDEAATARHSGEGRIDLDHGRFGKQDNLAAHVAGTYSPTRIEVPELRASSPQAQVRFSLHHENSILRMEQLELTQGKLAVLEGAIQVPLNLAQMGDTDLMFPDDGPVKIALRSRDLDLKALFEQLAQLKPPEKAQPKQKTARLRKTAVKKAPSPFTGTVNTTIAAEGTLKDLIASVSVRAVKLQANAAEKLAPAEVALDLNLRESRLKLSGTVTQREIKPLTINGDLPFDLATLKKSRTLDPATPFALRVSLPRSPLGFVKTLVPAIRFIDGTAAIDLRAGGTIGKPELSGSAQVDIPNLRLKDTSLPPVNSVIARIDFTGDRLTIRQLKGGVGGGSFEAGGSVKLDKLTEPVFDLRVTTRDALVMQNDDVTARVTSDLRVAGPLNAATVTGKANVTKGRFFKDIDILPIGLPGRPAPQPPMDAAPVGFPNPPLRDWKFDVAIKTQDPFLVQGNLANGRGLIDLKLGGTGAKPWLDGNVRIDNLMTSLPFSRLEITSGLVYFTPDKPFSGTLDIRGESTIRDYKITVYIYGEASAPQALFTSEPPLPQSEIVELIATGATAKELAGDANALAGRAAVLVAQKYFRKIFKKNEPSQPKDTLFKNVQFDVGAPDPHSGNQSLQVRLPLGESVVLSGGVDVGGDYRGQIKYSMRFR